jgi:hypothetical protein
LLCASVGALFEPVIGSRTRGRNLHAGQEKRDKTEKTGEVKEVFLCPANMTERVKAEEKLRR